MWKVSTRTGTTFRLTDDHAEDFDPAFSTDGKRIIWSSMRSGHFEIWMANSDGSLPKQISQDGVDAENATMTKDGQWIVYNSYNPQKRGIWKVRVGGTEAKQLAAGTTELPEVSPDGQYALFNNISKSRIEVVRISDGQPNQFSIAHAPSRPEQFAFGRARWTPDGKAIIFVDQGAKMNSLFLQDFIPGSDTSATRRQLLESDPYFIPESFGIAPDGSRITVSGLEIIDSLMVAENVAIQTD